MHIIGTEIEYGIVAVDQPDASPIETSTQAVVAYAQASGLGINRRTRWDYHNESPLRDIRGFDLRRYRSNAAPSLDPNALGAANVITSAGARFYVDHAHPEYSSPEVSSAWDALIWDKAGDLVMHRAAQAAGQVEGQPQLKIYKNNVDGKGASYGSHENYLYPRELDIEVLQQALIPHFVTRQIFTGSGRVGLGQMGQEPGFQLSQRADYIETTVSLETTLNRGIINTRDEPHSTADSWRRLHVIIGDANMAETANYLKFGSTALVLKAVAQGADFADLQLLEPVKAVRQVSRDLTCTQPLDFYGKRSLTAIETQREILSRVRNTLGADQVGADQESADQLNDDDQRVLQEWEEILDMLAADPLSTADRLDWTAKLALINGYRARGLEWGDPRLSLLDIQYTDIDPARSLYHALVKRGRMRTLADPADIEAAAINAPTDTRAWLRGYVVSNFSEQILAANWDSLILDLAHGQHPATQIRMDEPLQFTQAQVLGETGAQLSLEELVRRIGEINEAAVGGVG